MLLELEGELLCDLWPSSRVVLARRVCRRLREVLAHAPRVVLRTGRLWQPPLTSRGTVASDLCRLKKSQVDLLGAACRLPVESLLEGAALACRAGWTSLSTLDLSSSDIDTDLCDLLVVVLRHSRALTRIDLSSNSIGEASGDVLDAVATCSDLTNLSLSKVGLCCTEQLASSLKCLVHLQHLDVSANAIGDGGAQLLAQGLQTCTAITHLDVSYANVAERGGLALSEALPACARMQHLSFCRNCMGPRAAEVLFEGGRWEALRSLDLRYNQIGDSGVLQLVGALRGGALLEELDLGYNRVSEAGTAHLARRLLPSAQRLRSLKLKYNDLGNGGAAALAEGAGQCRRLELLVACYNGIEDAGATAAAAALGESSGSGRALAHLHLRSNRFTDQGAAALARLALCSPALSCLHVYGNRVDLAHLPALSGGRCVLRNCEAECRL